MRKPGTAESERHFVTALSRGLEILRAFGPREPYLGNAELAERTGIPRPTVSRLTATLTRLGYLHHNAHLEKYHLGAGVLALGYRYLASTGIREIARPHMQQLADAADCAVALGTADRLSMTYLDVCQGQGPLVLRLERAARLPMMRTAIGKAWLCAQSPARREALLQQLARRDPAYWPTFERAMDKALADHAAYGFCLSEGDWKPEVSAVAVPLVLEEGAEVMALNCGGPSMRLTHRLLVDSLGPRLKETAERIGATLSLPTRTDADSRTGHEPKGG
ncbi:IclR family transcriptional regulator [Stutzerimonas azotifigens]|uniref:IclR family transcriptional regulator n=1 Tax=Stutzerimonas azotifigens TaxID=291995 RepID=UPI0004192E9C|nr:IclR family transcriptional regulator [Stutzerimonas azotifigens]